MQASYALPAVNFFMADVGGGLGAFLSTWLAEVVKLDPSQVGWVVGISSLVGALCAGPAGALVDRVARPRLLLAAACCIILLGTMALLPARSFWYVLVVQAFVAIGGALGAPSISGLTLAVVGKAGYPRQQGANEAANHTGNVVAAAMIAGLAFLVGPMAAFIVLAVMAVATLATLYLMDGSAVDADRMRGRGKREGRGATRDLFKNRRLLTLLAVVGLFQLGNAVMLPLLGQRIVTSGSENATSWMSACVIVAQLIMVPVALLVGRNADRVGRRWLLAGACAVVVARCALAMLAAGNYWLVPIQILDGICAAMFSVAAPVAVADLTYGTGRTQTAMGAMATMQAGGAALASVMWGYAATHFGYPATFGAMALFPVAAIALLMTIELRDEQPGGQQAQAGANAGGNAAAASAAV